MVLCFTVFLSLTQTRKKWEEKAMRRSAGYDWILFYSTTLIGSHHEDTCTHNEFYVRETYLMDVLSSSMSSPSTHAERIEKRRDCFLVSVV